MSTSLKAKKGHNMSFYKLYYKLHHNTGYYMYKDIIDRICRPSYYEQKRIQSNRKLLRFMYGVNAINGAINALRNNSY